jgi:DNA mismatch repair protein MutL
VNGRFVRDRLIGRALSEGYRSILPHGVYPAALLFIDIPLEEVDVNVHPAKTEVRFRRAPAVADAVRDSVRTALASAGYARPEVKETQDVRGIEPRATEASEQPAVMSAAASEISRPVQVQSPVSAQPSAFEPFPSDQSQTEIEFSCEPDEADAQLTAERQEAIAAKTDTARDLDAILRDALTSESNAAAHPQSEILSPQLQALNLSPTTREGVETSVGLPPLNSASKFAREVSADSLTNNIRPLGQLDESFIIATDNDGLLLIDQHVAHERVLFDKYRALEAARLAESQQLLIPETFDLTPAQATVFDDLAAELELYGFETMRLSGRTVAIKATPADLPAGEARNMLSELLDAVDAEKKGSARETLRDEIAASLACHAAIKVNMPLTTEKMRWLIDRLLKTSSPTTCPHGRPVILRLSTRDILKGFHRI